MMFANLTWEYVPHNVVTSLIFSGVNGSGVGGGGVSYTYLEVCIAPLLVLTPETYIKAIQGS